MTSTNQNTHFKKVVSYGTGGAFAPHSIDSARAVAPGPVVPFYTAPATVALGPPAAPSLAVLLSQTLNVTIATSLTTGIAQPPVASTITALQGALDLTAIGDSVAVNFFVNEDATLNPSFAGFTTALSTTTTGSVTYTPSTVAATFGPGHVTVRVTATSLNPVNPGVSITVI